MVDQRLIRRPLNDVEEAQVRYELRLGNTERGIKKALQQLCTLYEGNRYLRDPTEIRQLIHSHLGSQAILLRRWSLKALGLIGHPDDSARIVDRLKHESDAEAQTWGAAALLKNADDRGVKEVCEEAGLEHGTPMLLAARLYAPDHWLKRFPEEIRVSIDDDQLTLKWAVFLVGYNRAPEQLFDPKHRNPLFLGELNLHPIPEISEYSVWALCERSEFGVGDLKIGLADVHKHPPSVRKWLYRLMLKDPGRTGLDPDALGYLRLRETDASAREGLAAGLLEVSSLDFSVALVDWYQIENDPSIRETLLTCIAKRSDGRPELKQLVEDSFNEAPAGGSMRRRLLVATSGTPVQLSLRKIEADDELRKQGLLEFYHAKTVIIGGGNDMSSNKTTFTAGGDIAGQILAGGDVMNSANAAVQNVDQSRANDKAVLEKVLALVAKLKIGDEYKNAVSEAVKKAAAEPTKENKSRVLDIIKSVGKGAMNLIDHADEIEHLADELSDWIG